MASTKNTIAGYGLSVGLIASVCGGLIFVMNSFGLIRNPEINFPDNINLIAGSSCIGGTILILTILMLIRGRR